MVNENQSENLPPRRYRWPWFVLGFVLLGVTLTVIAVSREAQRVKEQRAPWMQNSSDTTTNTLP